MFQSPEFPLGSYIPWLTIPDPKHKQKWSMAWEAGLPSDSQWEVSRGDNDIWLWNYSGCSVRRTTQLGWRYKTLQRGWLRFELRFPFRKAGPIDHKQPQTVPNRTPHPSHSFSRRHVRFSFPSLKETRSQFHHFLRCDKKCSLWRLHWVGGWTGSVWRCGT